MPGKKVVKKEQAEVVVPEKTEECFAIMPIGDQPDTSAEHFMRVYEDIIKPACSMAGFKATRADEEDGTNLIQQQILRSIIDAPICVCDLSCLNPNVMFELGIRQAFDLPVVLIKDHITQNVFDIQGLRYHEYNKSLRYYDVINFQQKLSSAIITTIEESKENIANSIIRLVDIPPAKLGEEKDVDTNSLLRLVLAEVNDVKSRFVRYDNKFAKREYSARGAILGFEKQMKEDYNRARQLLSDARRLSEAGNTKNSASCLLELDRICELYNSNQNFISIKERAAKIDYVEF
jgi:hypothetical protein